MSKVRADVLWHKKSDWNYNFLLESCNIVLCRLTHAISASWHLSNASSGSWKNWLFDAPVGSRKKEVQQVKMGSCYGISRNRVQMKVTRSEIRRLERIRQSFLVIAVNKFLRNSNCVMMRCRAQWCRHAVDWSPFPQGCLSRIVLKKFSVKLNVHVLLRRQ